jgi:hypothetical protein
MDFDYITVPAIIVLALVLVACGALRRIITLQRADQSRVRRWKEGIILWPVGLSCFAMAALGAVNGVALYYYRHPPPGNMYRVAGRLMRLQCMGQGSPTIVLEAGGGNDGLTWAGIQPKLGLDGGPLIAFSEVIFPLTSMTTAIATSPCTRAARVIAG